jgi:hypothetical protein
MRSVIAIDPTVRTVSLSRVSSDGEAPTANVIHSRNLMLSKSIHDNLIRAREHVDAVVEPVTAYEPELVILVSGMMGDLRRDPSAPRRLGLWWLLADHLDRAKLKVAEVPLLTVEKVWLGKAQFGRAGIDELSRAVRKIWTDIEEPEGFWTTTIAAAVVGAFAMSIDVPGFAPAVTDWNAALSGVTWPTGIGPGKPSKKQADEETVEDAAVG